MPRYRRRIVNALIWAFLIATGLTIFRKAEVWPFSCYPMFAGAMKSRTLIQLRLFAVPAADSSGEFLCERSAFAPLSEIEIAYRLAYLLRDGQHDPQLQEAVDELLQRYEANRVRGVHHGPPISALRLYECRWEMNPDADKIESPSSKRFLIETRAAE